jgi:hypothetical protein
MTSQASKARAAAITGGKARVSSNADFVNGLLQVDGGENPHIERAGRGQSHENGLSLACEDASRCRYICLHPVVVITIHPIVVLSV